MIELKNVTKSYGKKTVLKDVSLTLQKGEVLGLLGENGSGKTTLIEVICGLRNVQNGQVLYEGKPLYDNVEAKEKIAYVRDEQNYLDKFKGIDLIKMYMACYPEFDKEKINQLNEVFQLDFGKLISTYSKGQRMCMAFMLAMARKADYIILDEPFGGVDAGKQKIMKEYLIGEMEERGIGIILSTHQLEDLNRLCDKVAFVKDGLVERNGLIDDVIESTLVKYEAVLSAEQIEKLKSEKNISVKQSLGRNYGIYCLIDDKDGAEDLATRLAKLGVENPVRQTATLEECYCLYNENRETVLEQK